ncbi:MAG: T9SS type A sorting domain-containing protein [Chitinophagales bacterium]
MKKILLGLSVCFAVAASAQSLAPTVVATGGGYGTGGGYSLSYTIGEMAAVQTFTGGGNILTQGFQQPESNVLGLLEAEDDGFGAFSVYPNPTTEKLYFGYQFAREGAVTVTLYNAVGQQMTYRMNETYESGKVIHHLDCSDFAAGNYVLSAIFKGADGKEKSFSKKFQVIR